MSKKGILLLQTAKKYEEESQYWDAGEEYKCAFLEFGKSKDYKEEEALCKKKIIEMNQLKADDFKSVTAKKSLSEEQSQKVKDIINLFTNLDSLSGSLYEIGVCPIFTQKFREVKQESDSNMPISFLISTLSSQDAQGHLQRTGHDGSALSYSQNYEIRQGLITSLYLNPIMQKLMETKIDFDNLSDYFRSTKLFSENMLSTFDVGLERFVERDHVSSMHILVPIFEKTFIDVTAAIGGADTVTARNQSGSSGQVWTQDKALGEKFLKDKKVREIWGEDFCEQIMFVMVSPLGYKMRHKIAHGYAAFGEFNFSNNILILYFFLVIAARVKRKEKAKSE